MSLPKGIASVAHLQRRALDQRGGQSAQVDSWDRSKPDALALWRDAYLESLAARNYSEGTLEGRRDALKVFLIWAQERELTQAGQITRPHPGSLPAMALALHQGRWKTAGMEHPAFTAGHVERLVRLDDQAKRHAP